MPPTSNSAPRWRAVTRLKVEKRGEAPLIFQPDDECVGAPDNWPPRWVIDQELVVPMDEPAPAPAADEKGK